MSGSLQGYLVKGPRKIKKSGNPYRRAVRTAKQISRLAAAVMKDPDGLIQDPPGYTGLVEAIRSSPHKFRYFDVEAFVHQWNRHFQDIPDVAYRLDPDDDESCLVFAGEVTYGDDPDSEGYCMLEVASQIGVTHDLGIR